MAAFSLRRSDLFPVGTSVNVYPAAARKIGRPPSGSGSVATATVDAAGLLSFTGLATDTAYAAYALVNGEHRYTAFRVQASVPGTTWKSRVAARRAAIGTS